MIDVDKWLTSGKKFRLHSYNCWHFVKDVWEEATGEDLGERVPETAKKYRECLDRGATERSALDGPVTPCFAYYECGRSTPHIGVYYQGSVLHLDGEGVHYDPLHIMAMKFGPASYYT